MLNRISEIGIHISIQNLLRKERVDVSGYDVAVFHFEHLTQHSISYSVKKRPKSEFGKSDQKATRSL